MGTRMLLLLLLLGRTAERHVHVRVPGPVPGPVPVPGPGPALWASVPRTGTLRRTLLKTGKALNQLISARVPQENEDL